MEGNQKYSLFKKILFCGIMLFMFFSSITALSSLLAQNAYAAPTLEEVKAKIDKGQSLTPEEIKVAAGEFGFTEQQLNESAAPTSAPSPVSPPPAATEPTSASTGCAFSWTAECILYGIATALVDAVYTPLKWLVALAGGILDEAIKLNTVIGINRVVQEGWTFVRDVSNLIMVLILLIIGFSTVLQIEGWNYKKALPRLILIALLINFSLVFTGFIIDFTNILSKFFLDFASHGSLSNISEIIANGIKLQKLQDAASLANSKTFQGGVLSTFMTMIFAALGGSAVLLVAAFVLFASAVLLLWRIVTLWLAMILAPGAFLMYILPATQGYFRAWGKHLLSWSFFAPVYFFLLALAVKIINSKELAQLIPNTSTGLQSPNQFFSSIGFLLQYIMIIALLMMTLMWSRAMGVGAADSFLRFAGKAGKWFGKQPWQITARPIGWSAGKATAITSRIPLLGRLATRPLQAVAKAADKVRSTTAKSALALPDKILGQTMRTYSKPDQIRIWKDMKADRVSSMIGKMSENERVQTMRRMAGTEVEGKLRKASPESYAEMRTQANANPEDIQREVTTTMNQMSAKEIRALGATSINSQYVRRWFQKEGRRSDLNSFLSTSDKMKNFVNYLDTLGDNLQDIAAHFEEVGNTAMAGLIKSNAFLAQIYHSAPQAGFAQRRERITQPEKLPIPRVGAAPTTVEDIQRQADEEGEERGRQQNQQGGT